MAIDSSLPIEFTLATKRDDGGKTANYTVYECSRQMQVKNGKGEPIIKNAIMGSNGSIYIGHELAGPHTEWVLMPRAMFDQLYTGSGAPARQLGKPLPVTTQPTGATKTAAKKGKK
jgi:hypothetical protein